MMDDAFHKVANLDEPAERNFVMKHYAAELSEKKANGVSATEAQSESLYRIFGSKPGSYGAGILQAIDDGKLAVGRGPGECLYRMGFLRLRQAAARRECGAGVPPALRGDRCSHQEPGQP